MRLEYQQHQYQQQQFSQVMSNRIDQSMLHHHVVQQSQLNSQADIMMHQQELMFGQQSLQKDQQMSPHQHLEDHGLSASINYGMQQRQAQLQSTNHLSPDILQNQMHMTNQQSVEFHESQHMTGVGSEQSQYAHGLNYIHEQFNLQPFEVNSMHDHNKTGSAITAEMTFNSNIGNNISDDL